MFNGWCFQVSSSWSFFFHRIPSINNKIVHAPVVILFYPNVLWIFPNEYIWYGSPSLLLPPIFSNISKLIIGGIQFKISRRRNLKKSSIKEIIPFFLYPKFIIHISFAIVHLSVHVCVCVFCFCFLVRFSHLLISSLIKLKFNLK